MRFSERGVEYTLASSLNVPGAVPVAPTEGESNSTNAPLNQTRLALAAVTYPLLQPRDALFVRPSFGRKESALSPTSPQPLPIPLPSTRDDPTTLDNSQSASISPVTPLKRLNPLSAFSIPTLSSITPLPASSRPVRQFRGTSSTFVRSWDGLPMSAQQVKSLSEGNAGKETLFGVYTSGKAVNWVELGADRPKDTLCRIAFSDSPTCVDLNRYTASSDRLDILVGFGGSGDIFWFDPFVGRYSRFNKAGIICSSAVTSIRWLPPSTPSSPASMENDWNLFVTSHADGSMIVWDKDREDAPFLPAPSIVGSLSSPNRPTGKENDAIGSAAPARDKRHAPVSESAADEPIDITVTRPIVVDNAKKGNTDKFNPISHWQISKKSIYAFAFSPDLSHWSVVGEDGCLRIIDVGMERLLHKFVGYFGALICVAWSPDGRFVVTGGQDDLCTIYAPLEPRLVARCEGHSSFLRGLAWEVDDDDEQDGIRFASVAEDCKMIRWELSPAALSRPKAHGPYNRNRSSSLSSSKHRTLDSFSQTHSQSHVSLAQPSSTPSFHPSPRRAEVAVLQPASIKVVSNDPLEDLILLPGGKIVTLSRTGQIQLFERVEL